MKILYPCKLAWCFLTIFLLSAFAFQAQSQFTEEVKPKESSKPSWTDRVYFGGNLGLMVGSITQIEVSPLAGYRISDRFSAGLGVSYQYFREEIPYRTNGGIDTNYVFKMSIYGGKVFTTFDLIPDLSEYIPVTLGGLVLQAENEVLNVGTYVKSPSGLSYMYSDGDRQWINNLLVGGGLSQPIGERARVNLLVLWNLTENEFSPYSNPVVRIGFTL